MPDISTQFIYRTEESQALKQDPIAKLVFDENMQITVYLATGNNEFSPTPL